MYANAAQACEQWLTVPNLVVEAVGDIWRRPRSVATTSQPTAADWEVPVLEALRGLLQLPADWDSYGARAISPAATEAAWDLLEHIMLPGVPAPSVVPTSRGTVQLEWHTRGVNLEIDVRSRSAFHVVFEDLRTHEELELQLGADLQPLSRILRIMAGRQ